MTFPKAVRLRSRREFQRVAKEGKRLVGKFLCIDYRPAKLLKLGISASTRYGSAPERNRFKRLVREAFRQHYSTLPSYEINVIPRQCAKNTKSTEISAELSRLLHREGLGVPNDASSEGVGRGQKPILQSRAVYNEVE